MNATVPTEFAQDWSDEPTAVADVKVRRVGSGYQVRDFGRFHLLSDRAIQTLCEMED